MRKLLVFSALLFAALTASAQADKAQRPSQPAQTKQTVDGKTITIDYSQPLVKSRNVWDAAGKIAPYGKVWRTGANETTAIEFSEDVKVEGKDVPKGRYALFTIPGEKDWTIILNKTIKWGAFSYKQDEDVLRVTVPAKKAASFQEKFTINISPAGDVMLAWADAQADFKVK